MTKNTAIIIAIFFAYVLLIMVLAVCVVRAEWINWSFYTDGGGSLVIEGSAAHVSITSLGTNVQLYRGGISLEAGKTYDVHFRARGVPGERSIGIHLLKHTAPYTGYGLFSQVVVTPEWKDYTVQFIASGFTGSVTDGRLRFWFAGAPAGDEYFIEEAILVEVTQGVIAPKNLTLSPAGGGL